MEKRRQSIDQERDGNSPGLFTLEPALGLDFENRAKQHWCEESWLNRLAEHLMAEGVDYNLSDSQLPIEEMKKYKTIYALSFELMSKELQQKLLDYLKNGGRLVLPRLPEKDLTQKSCTLLIDALAEDKNLKLMVDDGIPPATLPPYTVSVWEVEA